MRRRPRCPAVWRPKAITILYHSFTFLPTHAPLAYPPATYRVECDCPMVRPLLSHLNRLHNPFIYRLKRVWYLLRSTYSYSITNDAGHLWRTSITPRLVALISVALVFIVFAASLFRRCACPHLCSPLARNENLEEGFRGHTLLCTGNALKDGNLRSPDLFRLFKARRLEY